MAPARRTEMTDEEKRKFFETGEDPTDPSVVGRDGPTLWADAAANTGNDTSTDPIVGVDMAPLAPSDAEINEQRNEDFERIKDEPTFDQKTHTPFLRVPEERGFKVDERPDQTDPFDDRAQAETDANVIDAPVDTEIQNESSHDAGGFQAPPPITQDFPNKSGSYQSPKKTTGPVSSTESKNQRATPTDPATQGVASGSGQSKAWMYVLIVVVIVAGLLYWKRKGKGPAVI